MKRFTIFSLTCFLSMGSVFAQQGVTQCGVPTGQPKFPLQAYQELPDPAAPSEKEWAAVTAPQVSWGTIDVRYAKHQLPALKKTTNTSLKGWRGERVNAQAVVWTGTELKDLNFSFTDFKDKKGNSLSGDALTAGFVRYVMTDELNKDGRGACGYRKSVDFDSLLVADPIDSELKTKALLLVLFSLSGYNAGFPSLRFPELIKDSYWLTTARICYSASILRLRFLPAYFPNPRNGLFIWICGKARMP